MQFQQVAKWDCQVANLLVATVNFEPCYVYISESSYPVISLGSFLVTFISF